MDFETTKRLYEALRSNELIDDILKLILDNSRLNNDKNGLIFDDERKLFDYIKLKFEDKYIERLAQLKNEKALEQEN